MPDVAQNNAAYEVWHKEYRAEHIGAADTDCKRIGNKKRDQINQHQAYDYKANRKPEGMQEAFILECFDIVLHTDKFGAVDNLKLEKGEINTLNKRVNKADDKSRECRKHKNKRI